MDAGTVLRWGLVLVVLLCLPGVAGAGLSYAVWQLESAYQGRERR